jgi:glucose 1-dehydrogenase
VNEYYANMNLPKPVVPSLAALTLLKGQTAVVTGANSGIGRAIALSLGKAGANVVVNYVTKPEDADAVAQEIRDAGGRASTARADVSDEAQVQAMFASAVDGEFFDYSFPGGGPGTPQPDLTGKGKPGT